MGLFKQMKDLKQTVEAAPGMIDQAMVLKGQAEQMAQAQQAAAAQQMAAMAPPAAAPAPVAAGDMEPIAGVSIELYAEISKGLAEHGYDQSKATMVAASHGVDAASWEQAMAGWNGRMSNPAVAQRFNALYTGR